MKLRSGRLLKDTKYLPFQNNSYAINAAYDYRILTINYHLLN